MNPQGEFEFPLTIKLQDAKGNILKMRLQLHSARRKSILVDRREVVHAVASRCCSRAAVFATRNQIVGINA
jgi:hypothetical protein